MLTNQFALNRFHLFKSHFTLVCLLLVCLCGFSGCGGSAGTVGISTGTALYSTAPASISVPLSKNTYNIGGGTAPYKTSSSSPQIANSEIKGNVLTINALTAGTAQIAITDASGSSISISVTVTAPTTTTPTFFTTAPESITLANNGAASFTISGGKPGYMISSSNTAVASVGMNGTSFFVAGIATGSAQVVVFDSTGTSVNISVTVGSGTQTTKPALYVTSASTLTLAINEIVTYQVGGGTPPYIVSSNNTTVATSSISGSVLKITGVSKGSAQVSLFDATGATVNLTTTVDAPDSTSIPLFVTAPSAISMAIAKQNSFTISGGKAPYTVSSSNTSVATTNIQSNLITIASLAAGSAQIMIFDATGTSISITLTVDPSASNLAFYSTAASSITMANNAVVSFAVGGGNPPYQVSSNNNAIATASVIGNVFNITSHSAGIAKISLFDATGTSIAIEVTTTQAGVVAIETQPSAATANVGDSLQFIVSGGTPPYNITVNNTSIASVSTPTVFTTGGSIFTSLLNAGNTTITILDALGQAKAIPLTVNQQSTLLRLSPSALTIAEDYAGEIKLNIFGGAAPYSAFTSDQTMTSVSTNGSILTVGLGTNTNRCINPIDTSGVRVTYGLFSVIITVVDSLGASATSTLTFADNGIGTGIITSQASPFNPPCL